MRRKLAAAVLAAGILGTAACGGDDDGDGGGRSTEEVCADLREQVDPLLEDLNSTMTETAVAAGQGDDAAAAEAAVAMNDSVEQVTQALRDAADGAEDEDFSAALDDFADELDGLASTIAGGEVPDQAPYLEASDRAGAFCE